jgi:hypothetical protein
MTGSLHEQLALEAERAQVSLNRFVTEALAASVANSESDQVSARHPAQADDSGRSSQPKPRALRVALATNLVVVVIAGVVALLLLVLALQRGL